MCGSSKPKPPPPPPPVQPPPPPIEAAPQVNIGSEEGTTTRRKVGRSQLRSQPSTGSGSASGLGQ